MSGEVVSSITDDSSRMKRKYEEANDNGEQRSRREPSILGLDKLESQLGEDLGTDTDSSLGKSSDEESLGTSDDEEQANVDENGNSNAKSKKQRSMDTNQFNVENNIDEETSTVNDVYDNSNTGYQIEAFNINEESKNGTFDKDGNYVELKEEGDITDREDMWIDDCEDVNKARNAKTLEEIRSRERQRTLLKQKRRYTLDDTLLHLKYFIDKEDTVLDTLNRFSKLRNKKDPSKDEHALKTRNIYIVNAIEFLTDLIELLENKSVENVYELTRSDIDKLILEEIISKDDLIDDYKSKIWNFKWLTNLSKEPSKDCYSNYEMQYWKSTYFKGNVIVKHYKDSDDVKNWVHIDCITFM
ncbi:hypothetical protein Kpol_2000p52 [Vanderwaltozyma polyspora DSM 70294]|uniref:GYF domain-containing protein n=1 Tax=Vanderwaltozyma polyspora (strain ATCC 22028 / DSM 70294 / BCRC 21397 / CBS 2163 / NBRC 10782 / NRRL Y-8283 / UCD 57-17) TaxID=436907 RepID=A7TF60_VANPO|nr:uncharacterized protein Kpol_2000p52 [Vanderwaltozyma polyspora DSM 70294]EDO19085.1 hypothetical protein Kpol_2000p52 [Vanderwaltozyma polyspora DSM 70294]